MLTRQLGARRRFAGCYARVPLPFGAAAHGTAGNTTRKFLKADPKSKVGYLDRKPWSEGLLCGRLMWLNLQKENMSRGYEMRI